MKLSLVLASGLVAVLVAACGGKVLDSSTLGGGAGDNAGGGGAGAGADPTTGTTGGTGTTTGSAPAPTPSGPSGTVACGSSACNVATEQCCVTFGGGGPGSGPGADGACVPVGKCNGDIALSCASGKNCPGGQVCCADLNGDVASATCQTTCVGGFGPGAPPPPGPAGDGSVQLCASDSECPKGMTCRQTPLGFGVCQPRRGGGGGGGHGGGGGGGGHAGGGG